MSNPVEQTQILLADWQGGDENARDQLFERLYTELEKLSAALLRGERNSTFAAGDLVNEAAIKLMQIDDVDWANRSHFMALAAKAMRRILIDHARKKNANKRAHDKVTLVTKFEGAQQSLELDQLEKALIRLGNIDKEKAQVVELRYFGNMSLAEIGEVMGTSESTVKRQWRSARAWLADAMGGLPNE